jgi:hypothetical protein
MTLDHQAEMALPKQEKQGNVVSSKTGIQLQQQ